MSPHWIPGLETVPLYEMPARVVEHVNELAVGMLVMVYIPSRSKMTYAVPDRVTCAPIEK
jgi:hypothetical protein